MELRLDEKVICARCRKDRVHTDICKAKDKTMRERVEIEFAVCGVCGKGYCSLRANPDERICEFCGERIYRNVKEDGSLLEQVVWKKKE